MKPKFPVGFYKFSKSRFFNYQLNRWHALGYTRFEDIQKAGQIIKNEQGYKRVFINLAEEARSENRLANAAFYYRAAEFLTHPADADKLSLYHLFSDAFYQGFEDENLERHQIAYGTGFLSAARLAPAGSQNKGTIVIHGGFDSFIEEFFCFWKYFSDLGYEVVAFDGPGQGAAHRLHGLAHEHDWEKPVGAVLDHFNLNNVTLLGIFFGGYWCVRAAAFEKRIKRLIGRVFTEGESAASHCQMGNLSLALSVMGNWLAEKTPIGGHP